MNATLAIDYLPIEQLSPYARNSRTHSDEQLDVLAHSIRTYGFNSPVALDADGGILAGHGRVLAALRAGLTEVPCIRLGHLSDAQKRAYVIADNRAYELGGWDAATLASEVEDLLMDADANFDLADIGFDADAFGAMASYLPDIEPTPDKPAPAKAKPSPEAKAAGGDRAPTADDYADVGQGAANPAEGKGLQYPLILQLNKPTFQQWRKFKGQRSDSDAIAAQLAMTDRHAALLSAVRALEARGFFAESSCADDATAADMAAMRDALAMEPSA